jgi:pantoate--beta-alanine ligase
MVKDLNFSLDINVCPTIREHDGLAMSSRNAYLDSGQRKAAGILYQSLSNASEAVKSGITSGEKIRELMKKTLSSEPLISETDYVSVCDPETLEEVDEIESDVLLAVAARIGSTRLIDNILLLL